MSINIEDDQCYCTVMYGIEEAVEADPFCKNCEGTGKTAKHDSLYEKMLKEANHERRTLESNK